MIKVDKNIPPPPPGQRNPYPWAEMDVGDSFFVPNKLTGDMTAAARNWVKRHAPEQKFTTRKIDGGVRVWRIK